MNNTLGLSVETIPSLEAILGDRTIAAHTMKQYGFKLDDIEFWAELGYSQPLLPTGEPDPESMTWQQYRDLTLTNIVRLEHWQEGSAHKLTTSNRIRNFGRIPLRLLKSQVNLDPKKYKRTIAATLALGCYSGAMIDSAICLDALSAKLPDDTCIHVSEFEDALDIEEVWAEQLNSGVTAEIEIIAGHGSAESVQALRYDHGRAVWTHEIEKYHIAGSLGDVMLGLASNSATILLDSCSTGKGEGAIAEVTHHKTGLHVIAPQYDVGLRFLRHQERRGTLDIIPGFYTIHSQGKKVAHRRSPARHYYPHNRAA